MVAKKIVKDPFADDEATEETTPVTETAPWEDQTNSKPATEVSVTLKGGSGYDEPWVVLRGGDVPAAAALVNDTAPLKELLDGTRKAADYFHTTRKAPAPGAAQNNAPAPDRGAAPGGETKSCPHGAMQYKSGVAASTGKPWKAWFCPTPKGTPGQCSPEFIR